MASFIYILSLIVSCFVLMQICSSAVIDDRYSPLTETENNDEQYDDQVYVAQRSAQFFIPPNPLVYSLNRLNNYRDFHPIKRQSFGRKHHWDAFFGRR